MIDYTADNLNCADRIVKRHRSMTVCYKIKTDEQNEDLAEKVNSLEKQCRFHILLFWLIVYRQAGSLG
ncbi:MAG: hypothetical protein H7257_07380 [Taibaiella sp.]|nr:hypothetical protein [Taibaiella sp.]